MKMNKEQFLKTEFGGELESTITAWDDALSRNREDKEVLRTLAWCQAQWEVYRMAIKHFYGVEYHFTRKTLKLPENQRTEDLSVSIQEKLRETDKVIIIDEAQNLKFLTLEEIRGWVDEDIFTGKPGIGIVLIGNVEVYNKMLGKQEAIFAQQFNRTKLHGRYRTSDIQREDIKVEAIGSGKKIRGRKHRNWRPDLLVLDDIENDENVRTPEQRKKLESWFLKAVSKAGDDYTDIIYIGTLLHYDSLLAKTLNNPGYKAIKYKAVISFSNEEDLWKEWEEIYTDLSNENHEADAREFFERHREKMLEGTEVLWEEKLSYYDLMVMRLTEGEASFNSEEQNEPINPEDCIFNPEWFEFYNEAEIDFKNRDFLFFGFVDPSLGKTKHSDFSAIITLAKHKVSGYMYVMDADIERRHPDKIIGDILEKEKMLRRDYGRGYKKFGAETVQFQWFLKEELAKASAKAGLYLPIEEVPQTSDKTMRIQTMQPDVKNHYIKFNKRHKRLLEQMEHFPMGAHDDGVDALEGCRTIAKKMKRFRVLDKGKLGL